MASNPKYSDPTPNWPRRGAAMSEQEFHELERRDPNNRYEYINSITYMLGGVTVGHDLLTFNLRHVLRSQFHLQSSLCASFGNGVQVLLNGNGDDEKHFVYPDLTVSCEAADKHSGNTLIEAPKLVVEVLSPGTEARDRLVKFKVYQNCPTIQEIVLVNQFAPRVDVWHRDEQDSTLWHYHRYSPTESPGEPVVFASVNVQAELEELYQDVDFVVEEEDEEDYDDLEDEEE